MDKPTILIADDEPSIRTVLQAHIRRAGYTPVLSSNGSEAIKQLQSQPIDLVITDIQMPQINGMQLLKFIQDNHPYIPVVVITAHGTIDLAVDAMREGAYTFINKPFDRRELQSHISQALADRIPRKLKFYAPEGQYSIIGKTKAIQDVFDLISRVADSPATVLIQGESGTGKELVARALHDNSSRKSNPFIQINCGAIPEQLFESELFGHEKGAFTGAVSARPGRVELADKGTLFLDEIGEMPKDMQVKLLRTLQDGSFDRVGGSATRYASIRLIAATNRNLEEDIKNGHFREDLFYRLNVIPIQLPPLRERTEDIPLLARHFVSKASEKFNISQRELSESSIHCLCQNEWRGNIRELENIIERAVLLADPNTEELELENLIGFGTDSNNHPKHTDKNLGLKDFIRQETARLEEDRITLALEQCSGNVTHTARLLGISRKSLQNKMRTYGLRDNSEESDIIIED